MNLELQIIDETLCNKELKVLVDKVNQNESNIYKLSVLPCHVPICKKALSSKIKLSTIIDFPFGILSTENRKKLVENSIDHGAQSIEILCPSYMIVNKLYSQIEHDLQSIYDLCLSRKIDLAYMTDYRIYTYDSLYKICKLLLYNKINTLYISTGYRIDDIYDHLIAMSMIQKKSPEIHIIPNCNVFNDNHKYLIKAAEIPTIRLSSIESVNVFR